MCMRIKTSKYLFPIMRKSLQKLIFLEKTVLRKQPIYFVLHLLQKKSSVVVYARSAAHALQSIISS